VDPQSTVLIAPSASVATLETPTVATFSAAFIVEPRRRPAGTTADGVHGREFVGNDAKHGVVTREQLFDISIVRYRLAQTAGNEQMPNLADCDDRV